MKKYACNRLYKASGEWMPQSVVSINERGEVESYAPLKEETSATEISMNCWMNSHRKMHQPYMLGTFRNSTFNKKHLPHEASSDTYRTASELRTNNAGSHSHVQ